MKLKILIASSLCFTNLVTFPSQTNALEPISTTIGTVAVITGLFYYFSPPKEQCHSRASSEWIIYKPDFTLLKQRMFGQHIAVNDALKIVTQHLADDSPSKALVLSFHGDTGVGKTFFAENLASAIYRNYSQTGRSRFVHKLRATHFLTTNFESTRRTFLRFIQDGLRQCERSLFIIEEIDKYPVGLLDSLIPFVESDVVIAGKTYNSRKSIFILLS